MKKTWIKIKRGLLRPEHRERLGIRIWLYMYMLDRVDWEAGTIFGWKDKDEAEDFGMAWRTLQKQRQEIEEMGYITCIKRKHSQDIIIHKWVNPREYDGKEYNKSTQKDVHSESKSTRKSTHKTLSKVGTPTYNSHNTNHNKKKKLSRKRDVRLDHPAIIAYREEAHLHVPINLRDDVIEVVDDAERWQKLVHSWMGKGWNKQNIEGMLDVYRNGWNKKKGVDVSAFDQVREEMERE